MCDLYAKGVQIVRAADCNPFVKKGQSPFSTVSNPVCISGFSNGRSGAKRRRRLADAIVRCCLWRKAKAIHSTISRNLAALSVTAYLRDRLPADNPVAALTCHLSCHSLPRLRFAYPQRESQGRFVPCAKQQFICIFHPFRTQNEPPFRAAHLRFLGDYLYISGFSMVSTGRNWEVPREAFRASPATHAT